MGEKIKLSFVNGGKDFILPHMTVGMQEKLLESMTKYEKDKLTTDEYNSKINKELVLNVLKKVDSNITENDILEMHPSDFVKISNMIWEHGRELSDDDENFRKTKKKE